MSTPELPVVDAHVHVDPVRFTPVETLDAAMRAAGVERAVLVQNLHGDNAFLARLVDAAPERYAAALWVDPDDPHRERELERWAATGSFRGSRLFADAIDAAPELWDASAELGLTLVVSFQKADLSAIEGRLVEIAAAHPRCRIVLTRFGVPAGATLDAVDWPLLERLAALPQVFAEAAPLQDRQAGRMLPGVPAAIARLLGLFGAERTAFGSSFPARDRNGVLVDPMAPYVADIRELRAGRLGVPAADLPQVASATALRLY